MFLFFSFHSSFDFVSCNQHTHLTQFHVSPFWFRSIGNHYNFFLMFMWTCCACFCLCSVCSKTKLHFWWIRLWIWARANNRRMIAYQFDLGKCYFFFGRFLRCAMLKNWCVWNDATSMCSACSRLNSLSHSVRVKSPNIIIIDIGVSVK